MMRRSSLLTSLLLVLALATGCGEGDDPSQVRDLPTAGGEPIDELNLSVDDVYARMEAAIGEGGDILHTRKVEHGEAADEADLPSEEERIEQWMDLERGLVRREFEDYGGDGGSKRIISPDGYFLVYGNGSSLEPSC